MYAAYVSKPKIEQVILGSDKTLTLSHAEDAVHKKSSILVGGGGLSSQQ